MNLTIQESQQDANAASIQEALRRGPAKTKEDTTGMPANPADAKGGKSDKGKGGKKGQPKHGKDGGKGGKDPKQDKPKGKGGNEPKGPPPAPVDKSQIPCIYFAKGKCMRDQCPYSHAAAPAAPAKTTPPKAGGAVAKAAMLPRALLRALRLSSMWLVTQVLASGLALARPLRPRESPLTCWTSAWPNPLNL